MIPQAQLIQNVTALQAAISAACQRSNRRKTDVTLMAVTKYAKDEPRLGASA